MKSAIDRKPAADFSFLALLHPCWNAFISRRALAPVTRKQTGASALRLICHKDQHEWRRAFFGRGGLRALRRSVRGPRVASQRKSSDTVGEQPQTDGPIVLRVSFLTAASLDLSGLERQRIWWRNSCSRRPFDDEIPSLRCKSLSDTKSRTCDVELPHSTQHEKCGVGQQS